jgi:3-isopropylmalate/(R)-2-methylmalate dehydratase large subunit
MAQTIAEKIISAHAGRPVVAGDLAVVDVDLAYVQDGTGPLTLRQLDKMGLKGVARPDRTLLFLDHAAPSPRSELSNDHKFLREFAKRTGAGIFDVGDGISHEIVMERYAAPGMIIVGADSHTCTGGAAGAFATGMGSTDIAAAFGLGKTWLRVPETLRVVLTGKLQKGVYPKDISLSLIGSITAEGANYMALELTGEGVAGLNMCGRITISNMAVECGAKAGIFPADAVTKAYLESMGRGGSFRSLSGDADAHCDRVLEINLSKLAPTISKPHFVDNTCAVDQVGDVPVSQVFLGTCTNGQAEDFDIAAAILKGKQVAKGTRLICAPPSRKVLMEIVHSGAFMTLCEAGAAFVTPGCGACVGVHSGILADDEVCLSTQNRNFQGRMGNPKASIYLASPATAAATAIKGKIADPREFL